jgi:hypothetical protein
MYTQSRAALEKLIQQERAQPAATMPQYIHALKNVNFSDEDSIGEFLLLTQPTGWQPAPQPVELGKEGSYKYQLISCMHDWEISSDIPPGTEDSWVAVEIRPTLANTKSPVQYVVPLGYLQCVATHTHRTRSTYSTQPTINTPFTIVLNIVDKSIWMVLDKETRDCNPEPVPIPANANGWDFLPEPSTDRPSFDVMQILTWDEFIALNQTSTGKRRLFLKRALATAKKVIPAFYAVADSIVKTSAFQDQVTRHPEKA